MVKYVEKIYFRVFGGMQVTGKMYLDKISKTKMFDRAYKDEVKAWDKETQSLRDAIGEKDTVLDELAYLIDSIDDLVVTYKNKGALGERELDYMAEETYIEFYALNHNYHIADALISNVTSDMKSLVGSSICYETYNDVIDVELDEEYIYTDSCMYKEEPIRECKVVPTEEVMRKYIISFGNTTTYVLPGEERIERCIKHIKRFIARYSQSLYSCEIKDSIKDDMLVFDCYDKEMYLEHADIDNGVKELCDEINSIECLFTMNSCQGSMYEYEKINHCPLTYVDFFVVDRDYHIADALLTYIVSVTKGAAKTEMTVWNEDEIVDEIDGEPIYSGTKDIYYRYRIDMTQDSVSELRTYDVFKDVVAAVKEFKANYKL